MKSLSEVIWFNRISGSRILRRLEGVLLQDSYHNCTEPWLFVRIQVYPAGLLVQRVESRWAIAQDGADTEGGHICTVRPRKIDFNLTFNLTNFDRWIDRNFWFTKSRSRRQMRWPNTNLPQRAQVVLFEAGFLGNQECVVVAWHFWDQLASDWLSMINKATILYSDARTTCWQTKTLCYRSMAFTTEFVERLQFDRLTAGNRFEENSEKIRR